MADMIITVKVKLTDNQRNALWCEHTGQYSKSKKLTRAEIVDNFTKNLIEPHIDDCIRHRDEDLRPNASEIQNKSNLPKENMDKLPAWMRQKSKY